MNKGFLSVVAVLALLAAGAWYVSGYVSQKPLTDAEDVAVRDFVTAFGVTLQRVPLQGPERKASMEEHYAPFVAPELIERWASEDADALGRSASGPWPASIEIATVRKTSPNSFVVEGSVVEVTAASAATGTAAVVVGVYPVTLSLKEAGQYRYLITRADKGAYSRVPEHIAVTGFWECVPIRDGEPQTEECIRGIALETGGHLIVELGLLEGTPVEYDPGTKVRIEGMMVPSEQLSTDRWKKYDIGGIISATTIEEVQ